jgi:hypothetical protein
MKQINTQKVWVAGTNTLVITVPKSVTDIQQINAGDYLEISFEKIISDTTRALKKELPRIKDSTIKSKLYVS